MTTLSLSHTSHAISETAFSRHPCHTHHLLITIGKWTLAAGRSVVPGSPAHALHFQTGVIRLFITFAAGRISLQASTELAAFRDVVEKPSITVMPTKIRGSERLLWFRCQGWLCLLILSTISLCALSVSVLA